MTDNKRKHFIPTILSIILPGAGQIYNGEVGFGIFFLFFYLSYISVALFNADTILKAISIGFAFIISSISYSKFAPDSVGTFKIFNAFKSNTIDVWVASYFIVIVLLIIVCASAWQAFNKSKESETPKISGISQWIYAWRRFKRNRLAVSGAICILIFYSIAFLCPFLAPYQPNVMEDKIGAAYQSPSERHLLGTDEHGRDVLSRVIYGSRISLSIGFVAVAISITLGTLVGAVSGYYGGAVDAIVMRVVDVFIAFPRLFLVLTLIAVFQSASGAFWLTIVVLGLTGWMGSSRIVRGQTLSLKEQDFVQAAKALGLSNSRIIFRHILPNVMAPIIVAATLGIGNTILVETSLSFLGLGVRQPTPTWGNIIDEGRRNLIGAWWISTVPGLAIVTTVISYNLVGDGLRDALDPRLKV